MKLRWEKPPSKVSDALGVLQRIGAHAALMAGIGSGNGDQTLFGEP
jgi:hypothetical protein